jgi:pimeloyl-ACP methyl ester carboxylesterase
VRANGLVFDVREAGPEAGDLVVLLHGFPQSSYEWRDVMPALAAAGYHAVAPDQRGYSPGARPVGDEHYTIEHMVADTLAIADHYRARRFHLVGHDWGAGVAWATAITEPGRIASLTVASVPHPAAYTRASRDPNGEQSRKKGYVDSFAAPGAAKQLGNEVFLRAAGPRDATDADVAEYARLLGTEQAMDAALAWYRANDLRADFGANAPAVSVPTLFLYGTEDCCLGRDAADLTESYVDAPYRYEVLEGVSHWIPEEAADALERELLAWLSTHPK